MSLFPHTPLGYQQKQHLRWFNFYRLGLALALTSQLLLGDSLLLIVQPGLYAWTGLAYCFTAAAILWHQRQFDSSAELVSIQIYLDLIFLILLMHAVGGVASGLGMLLIICIIASSLLLKPQLAFVFAAIASVGLLAEFLYSILQLSHYRSSSTQVGILGAVLFLSAMVAFVLSRRARENEALARESQQKAINLAQLNEQIIDNMQTGVLVLDPQGRVIDVNNSASQLLGYRPRSLEMLSARAPYFDSILQDWEQHKRQHNSMETDIQSLTVRLSGFSDDKHQNTLIFLEDRSQIQQRYQQSKLAALGQLTASIAHEIRNPLSSIAHAAELLSESPDIIGRDQRMTEIISSNSKRINEIIESIQQLSRGSQITLEEFALQPWIEQFLANFCAEQSNKINCFELNLTLKPEQQVRFNIGHLNQILTNLCDNGLKHGTSGKPIHIIARSQPAFLELIVADEGPGIPESERLKILEPFYSGESSGSGLGLYIVNQLCELNQASLKIEDNEWQGSNFCIQIPETKPKGTK